MVKKDMATMRAIRVNDEVSRRCTYCRSIIHNVTVGDFTCNICKDIAKKAPLSSIGINYNRDKRLHDFKKRVRHREIRETDKFHHDLYNSIINLGKSIYRITMQHKYM